MNITKFGAFVNILPGRDGLLHISKIGGNKRIERVEDVLSLGDKVDVVVREIDDRGKVSLSMAGDDSAGAGEGDGGRSERSDGDRGRERSQGGDGRGDGRGGNRGRGDDRNRRHRDREPERSERAAREERPGRTVVSFEDDFEAGL